MINLPNVTLYSIVHDGKNDMPNKLARVMNWTISIINFRKSILLTHVKPEMACKAEVVQFPSMRIVPDVQVFIVHTLHLLDIGDYVMGVHEDGFPIDPSMWNPEFLKYDYIGAPWCDNIVGNNGFHMCSKKFLECSAKLPFIHNPVVHSDNYYCRDHRKAMEGMGIKFAPAKLAKVFSVELGGNGAASFGFHNREHSKTAYKKGWALINSMGESNP